VKQPRRKPWPKPKATEEELLAVLEAEDDEGA
jgi:hypothetical protein